MCCSTCTHVCAVCTAPLEPLLTLGAPFLFAPSSSIDRAAGRGANFIHLSRLSLPICCLSGARCLRAPDESRTHAPHVCIKSRCDASHENRSVLIKWKFIYTALGPRPAAPDWWPGAPEALGGSLPGTAKSNEQSMFNNGSNKKCREPARVSRCEMCDGAADSRKGTVSAAPIRRSAEESGR